MVILFKKWCSIPTRLPVSLYPDNPQSLFPNSPPPAACPSSSASRRGARQTPVAAGSPGSRLSHSLRGRETPATYATPRAAGLVLTMVREAKERVPTKAHGTHREAASGVLLGAGHLPSSGPKFPPLTKRPSLPVPKTYSRR